MSNSWWYWWYKKYNNVYGTKGDDNLITGDENDRVYLYDGNDTLSTNGGDDRVYAYNGNKNIDTGSGHDFVYKRGEGVSQIDTGEGNDRVYAVNGTSTVNTGTGDDYVYSSKAENTISTGEGNDRINSYNATDDDIDTGLGNDKIYVIRGTATVDTGEGNDYVYVHRSSGDIDMGAGNDRVTSYYSEHNIRMGDGDDYIYSYRSTNKIDLGDGDDRIYSYYSNDIINGGAGNDKIYVVKGDAEVSAGEGNDYVYVSGDATVDTGSGNDTIYSFVGDQTVIYNVAENLDAYDYYRVRHGHDVLELEVTHALSQQAWFVEAITAFQTHLDVKTSVYTTFDFSDYDSSGEYLGLKVSGFDELRLVVLDQPDNDAPTNIMLDNNSMNEDLSIGSLIGTVTSDNDDGEVPSYSLIDDADSLFVIDSATGELRLNGSLDYENISEYQFTVRVDDNAGNQVDKTFTLDVNDVNENPWDVELSNANIAEDATVGTVIGTVASSNDAGETASYSLLDDADGMFTIDSVTGELKLAQAADFEAQQSHTIEVLVSDGTGKSVTQSYTVAIQDVNEKPTSIVLSNDRVNENTANGTVVATITSFNDTGETPSYSIESDAFTINAATGEISVSDASLLDFETTMSFDFTVTVTDGTGMSSDASFTMQLNDVNESPWAISLSNNAIAEDATVGTVIGTVASSNDAGETASYSLTDDADGMFTIDSATGELKLAQAADFEAQQSHTIEVLVSDGTGKSVTQSYTVAIQDVNEKPTSIVLSNDRVNENTANGTVVATITSFNDVGETPSYSMDSDAFTINAATGEISVSDASLLDFETTTSFDFTVTVTDGNGMSSDASFTMQLNDVNESPWAISLSNNAIAEDATVGTVIGTVASSNDAGETASYSLTDDADGMFTIDSATGELKLAQAADFEAQQSHTIEVLVSDGTGNSVTKSYTVAIDDVNEKPTSIVLSNDRVDENTANGTVVATITSFNDVGETPSYSMDSDAFTINAATGEISVSDASLLDFETTTSFDFTVTVTDGNGMSSDASFTMQLNDVNESPWAISLSNNAIAEDATVGTVIGTVASSNDAGETASYSLTDDADGMFTIDSATGELKLAQAADFEAQQSHTIEVLVSDGTGKSVTQSYTVAIQDVNEKPTSIVLSNDRVDENTANGTVVATITSFNDTGETPSYSIESDAFTINAATGEISVSDASLLDFEATTSFDFTVTVTDGNGMISDASFTMQLNDVNESPWAVSLSNDSVREDAELGAVIGTVASSNDAGETASYSLTDDADGMFTIDSATGELKLAQAADFEAQQSHTIEVLVSDGTGNSVTKSYTVAIQDVNEKPTSIVLSNDRVNENTANGTVVATITSFNDAGETPSYSIESEAFTINATTGEISVSDASLLDFETTTSFDFTVTVTDGNGMISDASFTMQLNDVNESPWAVSLSNDSVREDAELGAVIGTVASSNDAGETASYSLVDDADGLFSIDSATGEISVNGALDYETESSHNLTVNVSDGTGLSSQENITVNVTDVNETEPTEGSILGRLWHKTTVEFEGPDLSELGSLNPFRDLRLDVTFTHEETGETVKVPGYFAADGDAGNSGADSGSIWKVHLNAHLKGNWTYEAEFVTGTDIAADPDMIGESAGFFDGQTGSITIIHSDKLGNDYRAKGQLQHDSDEHFMHHEGSEEYYIKTGVDSPENFLAYDGFDNTKPTHQYDVHESDWDEGDPLWADGRGKEIIGSINYLAEQGVNSLYFLPMNVAGDGRDVWPWVDDRFDSISKWSSTIPDSLDATRYDTSKLDQWEVLFEHMQAKGVMLHFVTQETENDQLLNSGDLGIERSIYYRELIARYSHHNAITWNLGEENTNTEAQRKSYSEYIKELDPYDHLVVSHTYPGSKEFVYSTMLDDENFDGASLQSSPMTTAHQDTLNWINRSKENPDGTNWVVTLDEIGGASTGVKADVNDFQHNQVRSEALWGNLMAGGAGVEWYFGYREPHNDLNLEDFSSREEMYRQSTVAREFFETYLPFNEMVNNNSLVSDSNDYVLQKGNELIVVYYDRISTSNNLLDLSHTSDTYTVYWFDPRNGGNLTVGSVATLEGGSIMNLGRPVLGADDDAWDQVDYVAVLVSENYVDEKGVFNIGLDVVGTDAFDFLNGTDRNDVIKALAGDDHIQAGLGDDLIIAGDGNDFIFSTGGNTEVHAGNGHDNVFTEAGDDVIYASDGNDFISTGYGRDQILGEIGNDIIDAGGDNDRVDGGYGDDTIIGGLGADSLRGGEGRDTFVYTDLTESTAGLQDIIEDFVSGQDLIDLSQLFSETVTEENFSDYVTIEDKGYYQQVTTTSGDNTFMVDVITEETLDYSDFIFNG